MRIPAPWSMTRFLTPGMGGNRRQDSTPKRAVIPLGCPWGSSSGFIIQWVKTGLDRQISNNCGGSKANPRVCRIHWLLESVIPRVSIPACCNVGFIFQTVSSTKSTASLSRKETRLMVLDFCRLSSSLSMKRLMFLTTIGSSFWTCFVLNAVVVNRDLNTRCSSAVRAWNTLRLRGSQRVSRDFPFPISD